MFRRGRPLARAAMVGGAPYYTGKKVREGREADAERDARIAIPEGTSAAVALIEHPWAIPLRDKILEADGMVHADEWIHPSAACSTGG